MVILLLVIIAAVTIKIFNHDPVVQEKKPAAAQEKQPAKTSPSKLSRTLENYRFVALYGTPGAASMGALGSYGGPAEAVAAAKQLAQEYQQFSGEPIKPTFEIITTIASAAPTVNDDYSRELELTALQPWIDAAKDAGVYVVLDLQPGRTDFPTQAKLYEPLLRQPHVGLALDPEWRLYGDQKPLVQIGSVSADEVNQTSTWLADLTKQHQLPQKLFLLHQFRMDMLGNRSAINASRPELTTIIQMDGQGMQNVKRDTWRAVTANPPGGVRFGWKNFYQKDPVVLTPRETMELSPKPWYVSYQ
jgi:hypothetical protein